MLILTLKQGCCLLLLLLQFFALKSDAFDESDVETEFDDDAENNEYLAKQVDTIAEWSFPSNDREELVEELENVGNKKIDESRSKREDLDKYPTSDVAFLSLFHKNSQDHEKDAVDIILHHLEPDFMNFDIAQKQSSIYRWYSDARRNALSGKTNFHTIIPAKRCSSFPMDGIASSKVVCSSVPTLLGIVNWCKITCTTGHRLKKPFPHYELCGKATKYRWTFELRNLDKPSARCVVGNLNSSVEPCTTKQCFETAAYYMNKIDFSVNPCDSFFEYACGRWVKETAIPPYRSYFNTYSIIRERVNNQVADLLGGPPSSNDSDAVTKAKRFYKSCMNTQLLEKLDAGPLLNLLKDELAWPIIEPDWEPSDFDFEATVATLRGSFNNKVMMDFAVQKHYGVYNLESMKGKLPHKISYYTKSHLRRKLLGYFSLIKDIAVMLGADLPTALHDVEEMMRFEKKFTEMKYESPSYETLQDMTVDDMSRRMPEIDFLTLLKKMIHHNPVNGSTKIRVWNEKYLKNLINLVKKTSKRVVQNFMVWQIVRYRIENLSSRFLNRLLKLKKLLEGRNALPPRKYKCSQDLLLSMQGPTSKLFIDKYFTDAKRDAAMELFDYIRKGFIQLLDTEADWMDSKTKTYAKKKALNMKSYVGYNPILFENVTVLNEETKYLKVYQNDYFGNYIRLLEDTTQEKFEKLGQATDDISYAFNTRATMVNAYYMPHENAMILPSGEMQFPFYWGDKYPRVFQFGAIGTILGHELTHGFDNVGRRFGIDGSMTNWWTRGSLKEFKKRINCIEDQYNDFFWEIADEPIDGTSTLSENIADNGGIRESYAGYHLWLESRNMSSEQVEPSTGFTNDQMFFVGFANARCAKYSKRGAENAIVENEHSPGRFRIDGSLQNFDQFSKTFNCPKGSFMNPKKKCVVW